VWLSTIDAQGFPHIVPIWFVWDGEALLVFSKPHARKVEAMRRHARVAMALGEPRNDFDVQLIEGHATVLHATTAQVLDDAAIGREHARKYAAELFVLGIERAEYAATYSTVVRVNFHGAPDERQTPEVGYGLLPEERGKGYAIEAVRAVFDWARHEHGIHRFRASVAPDNERSLHLIEVLGFRRIGEQWDPDDGLELVFELDA
jgi:PPOX class probable F420-dependent enzyme